MQLSRRQTILIVTLSGVAALLIVGLLLLMHYGSKRDPIPDEPALPSASASPTPTATPEPTPAPTDTPAPTVYYLPLVPEGTEKATPTPATPTPAPTGTPTSEPEAQALRVRSSPREGVYNEQIREFMAIGTQNGEAIAVLLVHVEPPDASVVAIPYETLATVYRLGSGATIEDVTLAPIGTATASAETEREGCWNLIWAVKNLTGWRAPAYLWVDFGCMEDFFSFAPSLDGIDFAAFSEMLTHSGETLAEDMAQVGVGAVRFLSAVSLWELPAFRSATRGSFASSLSIFELLSLMSTLREVTRFSVSVLPTELKDGVRVLSDAAALPF